MVTRFNSFTNTSNLATESTLGEVRDKLNDSIDVNVVGGSSGNVNLFQVGGVATSVGNGSVDTGTQRVSIATGNIPRVDILSLLDGNTIDVNSGNLSNGTQRVVLASNQPEVAVNLESVNTQNILSGAGSVGAGCLRIVLADEQPILQNATVRIGGDQPINNIEVDNGVSSIGCQRMVQVNDQQYDASASMPVIIKANYSMIDSHNWHGTFSAANGANYDLLDNTGIAGFTGLGVISANIGALPVGAAGIPMYLESTSANDAAAGVGAQLIQVQYYNSSSASSVTTVTIPMAITPLRALIANDVYRIRTVFVAAAGTSNFNEGTITIHDAAALGNQIPGQMDFYTNLWNSAHLYLPPPTTTAYQNTISRGLTKLDYVNVQTSNSGGSSEVIRVYTSVPDFLGTRLPWQVIKQFTSDDNLA